MHASKFNPSAQRGVSLSGLIFVLAIIGLIAMFALKVIPSVIEWSAIKSSIMAAKNAGGTVRDMQIAFDNNASVNTIESIKGKDLIFIKDGEGVQIAFEYEKRLALFDNVALLINYKGTTDPRGVVPPKEEPEPAK